MQVFGKANLIVSVDVENQEETLALLEANYKFVNTVKWELVATDCKGNKHSAVVHDADVDLSEVI